MGRYGLPYLGIYGEGLAALPTTKLKAVSNLLAKRVQLVHVHGSSVSVGLSLSNHTNY